MRRSRFSLASLPLTPPRRRRLRPDRLAAELVPPRPRAISSCRRLTVFARPCVASWPHESAPKPARWAPLRRRPSLSAARPSLSLAGRSLSSAQSGFVGRLFGENWRSEAPGRQTVCCGSPGSLCSLGVCERLRLVSSINFGRPVTVCSQRAAPVAGCGLGLGLGKAQAVNKAQIESFYYCCAGLGLATRTWSPGGRTHRAATSRKFSSGRHC